jgi:hypothetical protein
MTTEYTCPHCKQYQTTSLDSLGRHVGRSHKNQFTRQQLYEVLFLNGTTPTCKCGCGEPVKFLTIELGFREYKVGHISRINNNYQTEKSVTNSKNTIKKLNQEGKWNQLQKDWSKGLTKETDQRVKNMADSINSNSEEIRKRSERFSKLRLDGTVQTLYGPEHSQWKGGVSTLSNLCRSYTRFYKEWKYPRLVEAGFKCSECPNTKPLEVHHDKETFSEILRSIAKKLNWEESFTTSTVSTEEIEKLKQQIKDAVVDYHVNNNISGKVLCYECHLKQHDRYNFSK